MWNINSKQNCIHAQETKERKISLEQFVDSEQEKVHQSVKW